MSFPDREFRVRGNMLDINDKHTFGMYAWKLTLYCLRVVTDLLWATLRIAFIVIIRPIGTFLYFVQGVIMLARLIYRYVVRWLGCSSSSNFPA